MIARVNWLLVVTLICWAALSVEAAAQEVTVGVPPPPVAEAEVVAPPPPSAQLPPAQPLYYAPPPMQPPQPVQTEPVTRTRRDWAVIGSGIGMFAGGWLLTWIGTVIWYDQTTECTSTGWFGYTCTHYGPDDETLGFSFIPLVGPWLMLGGSWMSGADYVFPVIAGAVQTAGLVMLIVGLATPEQVVVERPVGTGDRAPTLSLAVRGPSIELALHHF